MKLYIYDHCPFCVKARMIFGLKQLPLELVMVDEDDVETPTRLIGKKMVPILEKEDGSHMGESMDIVHYIDGLNGSPVITAPRNAALGAWMQKAWRPLLALSIPRLVEGDFAELQKESARSHYRQRETEAFGDLDALIARTPELVAAMNPMLEELAGLLASETRAAGTAVGEDDIDLFAMLRTMSIVKELSWPAKVQRYMENMAKESGVNLLFA